MLLRPPVLLHGASPPRGRSEDFDHRPGSSRAHPSSETLACAEQRLHVAFLRDSLAAAGMWGLVARADMQADLLDDAGWAADAVVFAAPGHASGSLAMAGSWADTRSIRGSAAIRCIAVIVPAHT